jgi:hypothetical protein
MFFNFILRYGKRHFKMKRNVEDERFVEKNFNSRF